jgi:hypothetical protein
MNGLVAVIAACLLFGIAAFALYLAVGAAERVARGLDRLDETTREARRR